MYEIWHINLGALASNQACPRSKPHVYIDSVKFGHILAKRSVKYHEPEHGKIGNHYTIDLPINMSISVQMNYLCSHKKIEGGSLLGVPFVDPLAGIVVSGMIFKAGIETGYQSAMELVDAGAPLTVLAPIRQTITQVEGVKGCHRLRGRQAGSFLYLDVHIEVDPFLSVSAAHDIGENVRQLIQKSHNQVAEVFIHIDPSYSHCSMSDPRMTSKNLENQNANISKQQEAEAVVSLVISSLFKEKMTVEHITLHKFGGNVLLQVQVSMPPEMMIQDAINLAREAEKEILKTASNINQVSILLRLGHPIQGAI